MDLSRRVLIGYLRSGAPIWGIAGGALPATDTFTGTTGTALTTYSASWSNVTGTHAIQSNGVRPNTGSAECCARWNADAFDADQYAQIVLVAQTSADWRGVSVRCASGAVTYYGCYASTDSSYLNKQVAGSYTDIASSTGWANGTTMKLTVSGTSLTVTKDGASWFGGAKTDSSIASGSAGISGYGTGATAYADNWEGGNNSVAAGQPTQTRSWGVPTGSGRRDRPGGHN